MIVHNTKALHSDYPIPLKSILNMAATVQNRAWLSHWSRLNKNATPLWQLLGLARRFGVAQVALKDESVRSELGSFKVLGAPVALLRLVHRMYPALNPEALIRGQYAQEVAGLTVISATDGNHGRALAAAAQSIGCRCVIVLHGQVVQEREDAIAAYGAKIVRISGNYDDSVNEAARLAAVNKWFVVSDTSYEGYEVIPGDVMQGYASIAAEIIEQQRSMQAPPFTHVFLQGGVGGLAAGVASYLWEYYGRARPRFIVVEPKQADCLYQSALSGKAAKATGSVDSVMAGLACGETSPLAWRILQSAIDDFLTIDDADAVQAMKVFASGTDGDVPVLSGESGAAGLGGLLALQRDGQMAALNLNADARVLLINTEGATAPSVYCKLVHESAESVLQRQSAWLAEKK